ncbi:AI-2E family transporter [Pontimicrobium aquaticum]|uniref:AI-2E family transporter n=1 Tax=Pontimicrobium aquaticum TaxID=2565367 RepID=A0A4U0EK63_9FLAO|nr:AI-2E family transporter [Pontimicrobium aquaticum]TJY31876.1 AI-2E family transporter [Pontimicrobium aquaticum]
MNSKIIANGILRALAIVIGVALLIYFLYKIQSVIVYIAIASVISLIGLPIVRFLKSKLKFKNTFAVVTTMVLLIALLVGLVRMFIPLVVEQGHNLALLDINQLQGNIEDLYFQLTDYFGINSYDVEQSLKESNLLSKLDYSIIPNFLNSVVSGFGSFSVGLFSVIFIAFFLLKDSKLLEQGILVFVPDNKETRSKKSFEKIKTLLSRYFVGLIFQILILFVIYTIVLLFFGVKNAVVIAFLCALLNLIPYVGPMIGGVLMLTLTMSSFMGSSFSEVILPKTTYVMIGFIIGQLVDNFFSQPKIFSAATKAHPLEIFLVIIIAGILFGVIGMIVAIPTYTAIKVILKEFLADNKIVKQLTKNL